MAKVVTSIPKLDTLILIKHMLKKHSFQVSMITIRSHPYLLTISLLTFLSLFAQHFVFDIIVLYYLILKLTHNT